MNNQKQIKEVYKFMSSVCNYIIKVYKNYDIF